MSCALCALRKPRRFCPAAPGDICTVCCGTSREQTLDCPLDCPHLRQAHQHEKRLAPQGASLPNQDVPMSESFLREHEWVFVAMVAAVTDIARSKAAMNDWDLREALDCLIRTYRTLESGLYYESKPVNLRANEIFGALQACVADIRRTEANAKGMATLRDATVLMILVFLERLERVHNNGRARSRAFIASLCEAGPDPDPGVAAEPARLIL